MPSEETQRKLDLETFGEPDAWKLACPVRGWGRVVISDLHHSTRANSGWRATAATLRECELSFTMNWKPGDAFFTAVKTAMLNSTTLCLAALTGAKDAEYSSGPHGNFAITKFDRKEGLEEAITVDVTAKLAKYIAWVDIAGA